MIIKTNTGKAVTITRDELIIRDKEREKTNSEILDEEIEKIFNDIFGLKRKEN